jgi:hypothetical protein
MEYVELKCHPSLGEHTADLLVGMLADVGFESFLENENGTISAFIQAQLFTPDLSAKLSSGFFPG